MTPNEKAQHLRNLGITTSRERVAELIRGILANIDEINSIVEGGEDWFCDGYPFENSFEEVGAMFDDWRHEMENYDTDTPLMTEDGKCSKCGDYARDCPC